MSRPKKSPNASSGSSSFSAAPGSCRTSPIEAAYRDAVARAIITVARNLTEEAASVGRRRLVNFLRGNVFPRSRTGRPLCLEGFGLLEAHSAGWLGEVVDRLVEENYLTIAESRFPWRATLQVTPSGRQALEGSRPFPREILPTRPRLGTHPDLEERLQRLRFDLAAKEGRAAFTIFPNSILAELATKRPRSLAELAAIRGFGEARIRQFGRKILAVLASQQKRSRSRG